MKVKSNRIESIDILRGLVMVIMALDHVRDYSNLGYLYTDPTNMDTTSPALFFTRWITHFCAPVFVFLAGTSAFLYGSKKSSKKELATFLFTRGLWLIFIELTVVNFAWTFDIGLGLHIFQVIWAIGICMVFMAALIYLNKKILLALGLLILFAHNLLDGITMQGNDPLSILWYYIHQQGFAVFNNGESMLFLPYPFVPWLGIMILGYCFGHFYQNGFDVKVRKKWLLYFGLAAIVLFIGIRFINIYGNLTPWSEQKNFTYSLMSFLNTTKYPPSLLYTLMTLGPAMLFLYAIESIKNWLTNVLVVIGRVPFFYYILHLYVIHLFGIIGLTILGENWKELIYTPQRFTSGFLADKGFDLWVTYALWIFTVVLLYPLCKKYMIYKANNRDKWWLSYL
nr:heparan-alpha-glucosaminide N-acetyltransferase domain-containing protein [uncultured Psychroserpens sp.]